jgi:hypothetical protein
MIGSNMIALIADCLLLSIKNNEESVTVSLKVPGSNGSHRDPTHFEDLGITTYASSCLRSK